MGAAGRTWRRVIVKGATSDACLPFIWDATATMVVVRGVEIDHVELQGCGPPLAPHSMRTPASLIRTIESSWKTPMHLPYRQRKKANRLLQVDSTLLPPEFLYKRLAADASKLGLAFDQRQPPEIMTVEISRSTRPGRSSLTCPSARSAGRRSRWCRSRQ